MDWKFKRLYYIALLCFLAINIGAIFFIFRKYKAENSKTHLIATTKIRFSKLKEKIESIESSMGLNADSLKLSTLQFVKAEEQFLDSVLLSDQLSTETIEELNGRIFDLSQQSNSLNAELIISKSKDQ